VRKGEISISRTEGGIPVVVETLPSSSSVALAAYVNVGSRNEPVERAGMAHLLEHMVFRGTEKFTSRQISERIEDAGGELNGFTSKEFTCYYSSILKETFESAGEILGEVIAKPLLTEDSFSLEKQIVTQEVSMLLNEPESYIHYLFTQAIWEGHPMSIPEAGVFETIGAISLDDLRNFYASNYSPESLIVVASGGVEAGKVEEWASSLDSMPRVTRINNQLPPAPKADIKFFPREGDQAYVGLGFPGLSAGDPARQVQRMLGALLGAGMSSRLFQKVREEEGLVYSIYSISKHYSDCGNMGIYFSCSKDKLAHVLDSISSEFSLLKREGLEPGELDRVKRLIKGATVRRLESTENRMFRIGDAYVMTGKVKTVEEMIQEMEEITEDQILAIAEEMIRPEKICVAIHGPVADLDRDVLDF
jgi:predicted Zn-dependent peptidase